MTTDAGRSRTADQVDGDDVVSRCEREARGYLGSVVIPLELVQRVDRIANEVGQQSVLSERPAP